VHPVTHQSSFEPKAQVPFLNRLAREFKRSRPHIWYVCTGRRSSPLREKILARQIELIRENLAAGNSGAGRAQQQTTAAPGTEPGAR
jgi:hypothetical protein